VNGEEKFTCGGLEKGDPDRRGGQNKSNGFGDQKAARKDTETGDFGLRKPGKVTNHRVEISKPARPISNEK